jgi:hypothetical protein
MGAGQSTNTSAFGVSDIAPKRALHILRVAPGSPAAATDLTPFFDFIAGYEGGGSAQAEIGAAELERIVEAHEGRVLNLLVWNSQNQDTRCAFDIIISAKSLLWTNRVCRCVHHSFQSHTVVSITPSRDWSLPHAHAQKDPDGETPRPSLLGLSMRVCEPELALENVWHVMDVLDGSPAESAGLVPYGDWIVGWAGGPLSSESDFYDVVEAVSNRAYLY